MAKTKPRIVIIGAGMAGLAAAHHLHTSHHLFDLHVVEAGNRIGGRIKSSDFCGDRVELGATWIHGIHGSPVHKIALDKSLLLSHRPWECMDGLPADPVTVAEGGHQLSPSITDPISKLFKNLMDFAQGKDVDGYEIAEKCSINGEASVGSCLRKGLEGYWGDEREEGGERMMGKWRRRSLEAAVFAMHENTQRSLTAADDLNTLDYAAERDYVMFPGEEITIGRGYSSVIEVLASELPTGMIQLGRKVEKIEWQIKRQNEKPVRLIFSDGTILSADHVIITVSLGVLKRGIKDDYAMFNPPLPTFKIDAISKLGFGVVNKVFLQLKHQTNHSSFPFLQMVFHQPNSELRNPTIPNWIRKTSSVYPIYSNSRVVLSWFTGKEALELESLSEEQIINGFSSTVSNLLSSSSSTLKHEESPNCNGNGRLESDVIFGKVLKTRWGTNPLFLGSYSYVAVGSSVGDIDALSEPLPPASIDGAPLQILFAGEATHTTHYSTTHGAYFSGLREANRLLKHYNA